MRKQVLVYFRQLECLLFVTSDTNCQKLNSVTTSKYLTLTTHLIMCNHLNVIAHDQGSYINSIHTCAFNTLTDVLPNWLIIWLAG